MSRAEGTEGDEGFFDGGEKKKKERQREPCFVVIVSLPSPVRSRSGSLEQRECSLRASFVDLSYLVERRT